MEYEYSYILREISEITLVIYKLSKLSLYKINLKLASQHNMKAYYQGLRNSTRITCKNFYSRNCFLNTHTQTHTYAMHMSHVFEQSMKNITHLFTCLDFLAFSLPSLPLVLPMICCIFPHFPLIILRLCVPPYGGPLPVSAIVPMVFTN